MPTAVLIKVLCVDESLAWFPSAAYRNYVRKSLLKLLRRSTPMTHGEAKRIIREVLSKDNVEIMLIDPRFCDSICHSLTSLGATFELSSNPKLD